MSIYPPSSAGDWPLHLTVADLQEVVFGSNTMVQERFRSLFATELGLTITALARAHVRFQRMQDRVRVDEQTATVQLFIHSAISSVLASLHHLVSGYPIAAGHMMRHFTESLAMAMLCIDERTDVYRAYAAARDKYPVHKAPDRLRRKKESAVLQERFGFDASAWEQVLEIAKLYDELSHVSALTLGYHMLFTETGGLVLGSEFDPAKVEEYRSDIVRRRSAAEALAELIPALMDTLPRRTV